MKIRAIEISNYRSLREVKMSELGDLIILIGKNGSGKSNILEALELFFADLNLQANYAKAFEPTTWYDKRTQRPIDFVIELEMDDQDLKKIFDENICKQLGIEDINTIGKRFIIHRRINVNLWENVESKLGDVFTIKNGKIIQTSNFGEAPTVDALKEPLKGPTKNTAMEKPLSPEISNLIFTNIHNILKNQFKLIRSPRESPERPPTTVRPTIVDPESKSYLNRLAVSPSSRDEEDIWTEFEDLFSAFSGRELRVRGSVIEFRVGSLSLPIELSGSGDQALMILMRHLLDSKPFYAIEEPETRLHQDYQRKLFKHLKTISTQHQIFLATHSAVFVDKAFLNNTWFTTLDDKETKVKKVEREDLRLIFLELGMMPSDFFFANRILFVEGLTEKYVIDILAEKIGMNLADASIIPIHGKDKGKYHLEVWMEASKDTNLPTFLLLDRVSEKEIKKLESKRLLDREHYHILSQKQLETADACDIEDYYPKDILKEVVVELAKENQTRKRKDETREDIQFKDGEPVVRKINDFLGRNNWKLQVAINVMQRISKEQIEENMDEIIRFLRKVAGQ